MQADAIRNYILAKDGNRPHLIGSAFAEAAEVAIVAPQGTISLPSRLQGRAAIADALARRFGEAFENVYTFCLGQPPAADADRFACDWLVGMSEKASGAVRVGCGRYDWTFAAAPPRLVERLVITIECMATLPAERTGPVMAWLAGLPYPWCRAATAAASAPTDPELSAVLGRITGRA
ncbi:MAG: hypothetical protein IT561_06380 [Alphaproteobacteria bacterium]|nr:hypothetical protein [Alphaproteobacteria bacterium]